MPVRAMWPSVCTLPAPMACAPRMEAVMAMEIAGNCT